MVKFDDLGLSIDLDNRWKQSSSRIKELQPYIYDCYECDDIKLFVLMLGVQRGDSTQEFLKHQFEQSLKDGITQIEKSVNLDDAKPNTQILLYDNEKSVYNYKYYAVYSNNFVCFDVYFEDVGDAEFIKQLISTKVVEAN